MPRFTYIARDRYGQRVESSAEAQSPYMLVSSLRERGLTVISIGRQRVAKAPRSKGSGSKMKKKAIDLGDLAGFCRQLATLVEAGVPIVGSLEILTEQVPNKNLREIVADLKESVKAGDALSAALARHSKIFPALFTSMTRVGEETGELSTILSRMASHLEKQYRLRKQIKSATTYPLFITGFFLTSLAGIVFFLIPKFKEIFSDFDLELPFLTRALIAVSNFATSNAPYGIGGLAFLAILWTRWSRTINGRYLLDRKKIGMPIVGELIKKVSLARFSQTLSTLMGSGVPVAEALEIAGRTSGNLVIEEMVEGVRAGVVGGSSIAEGFRKRPIFPKLMVGMVAAGEESGALAQMLEKVADTYAEEVDSAVSGLTSVIEPVLIVGLGAVILVVVLAIYLPIFKMATGIH